MITIAYDLDGVLIPDCNDIPFLGGLEEFYTLAFYMRPLFIPQGEYSIITARSPTYKALTNKWVDKHLTNLPKTIFHNIQDITPEEYKADVINNEQIAVYVESDLSIVNYLKINTSANIIYFSEFIGSTINNISS